MINKRLLVKHLLAHNDESSFYDKKRKIDIGHKEGKAKFLKHICALSNSNPANNSYIIIGVEDGTNQIVGVDFFDDSKIQNLINAYFNNPPNILYENVNFPHLPDNKVVGLVTIRAINKITSLKKNIWKYWGGTVFFREGSISKPQVFDVELKDNNSKIVEAIEQHARNNIELTLDGVIDFINNRHGDLKSQYKVFKEQFVVCWAGIPKQHKGQEYFSRVDIELINEQVRLFYSALDEVTISFNNDQFKIVEYVTLGLNNNYRYYPLEEVRIAFSENGSYSIETTLIFDPPQFDKKSLHHIMNANNALLDKLQKGVTLTVNEQKDLTNLPSTYLLCFLNDFIDAREKLTQAKPFLKQLNNGTYQQYQEASRILRKVKYN